MGYFVIRFVDNGSEIRIRVERIDRNSEKFVSTCAPVFAALEEDLARGFVLSLYIFRRFSELLISINFGF